MTSDLELGSPASLGAGEYNGTTLSIITNEYGFGKPCTIIEGEAYPTKADEETSMPCDGIMVADGKILLSGIVKLSTMPSGTPSGETQKTFDFTDEDNGETEPLGFQTSANTDTIVDIIGSHDGRNKVLRMLDNNGAGRCSALCNLPIVRKSGIIEYYWWFHASKQSLLKVNTETDWEFILQCGHEADEPSHGKIEYQNGSGDVNITGDLSEAWVQIKILFRATGGAELPSPDNDLAEGKWKVYINSIEYGDYNLKNDDGVKSLWFATHLGDHNSYISCFDTIIIPYKINGDVYISTTAGELSFDIPSDTEDNIQYVGKLFGDVLLFNPDKTILEHK